MKVIKPIAIDSSSIDYSSVLEPTISIDPPIWVLGTSYLLGSTVYLSSTHKIYQALTNIIADNISPDISIQLAVPKWVEIGSTNKFAMFDLYRNTPSIFTATTMASSTLEGSGDPYYDQVVFLADFEETVGGGVITDKSKYNNTVTIIGSGNIVSSTSKFGTRSWQGASSSYFTITLGDNGLMTGDFTWECHIRTASNTVIFYSTTGGGYLYNGSFQSYGGSNLATPTQSDPFGLTFSHIVICRSGSTIRAFKDGVLTGTVTYSGTVDLRTCRYGTYVPNNNLFYSGYIDQLRITKGIARYTANFTPPISAYPDAPKEVINSAKVSVDVVSTDTLSIALLNLVNVGRVIVQCIDNTTSAIISTTSYDINNRDVYDWWTYFTTQFVPKKSLVLDTLPAGYSDMKVIVYFLGSPDIEVGSFILGTSTYIGMLQQGSELDVVNFSTMERDLFGNATLVPRRSISSLKGELFIPKEIYEDVMNIKEELDAIPALWVGIEDIEDNYYQSLLLFGIYRDFNFKLDNPIGVVANLELEEM